MTTRTLNPRDGVVISRVLNEEYNYVAITIACVCGNTFTLTPSARGVCSCKRVFVYEQGQHIRVWHSPPETSTEMTLLCNADTVTDTIKMFLDWQKRQPTVIRWKLTSTEDPDQLAVTVYKVSDDGRV